MESIYLLHIDMHEPDYELDDPQSQLAEWKTIESTVKSRSRTSILDKPAAWLRQPSNTHVQCSWNWSSGRFPDRSIPYAELYGDEEF